MRFSGKLTARRKTAALDQIEDVIVDLLSDRRIAAWPKDQPVKGQKTIDAALVWCWDFRILVHEALFTGDRCADRRFTRESPEE